MRCTRSLLIPALAFGAALVAAQAAARADALLAPGQAHIAALGEARAVTYYTVEGGGAFRVVTTVATTEDATPLRSTAVLQPGQATSISVPGAKGTRPYEITFRSSGDGLSVEMPRQQDAGLR
jgi:hypothetical protein